MGSLVKVGLLLGALYLLVVLVAFLGQRRLMYFPERVRVAPAAIGLTRVEERIIETVGGERLVTWWSPARAGQPTLLYFHGNAGSLATRAERIGKYAALGRGVVMMAYRGYAGSTGAPSETANVADARRVYEAVRASGVAARDIILYGESLGSGVAAQLAAAVEVGGLILDAPYTSAVDVGAAAYPYLPVRLLMQDRYDTLSVIASVRAPVLIIHGERDEIIPVAMGRKVFAAANEPKTLATFPNAGHADHWQFGSYDAVNKWIGRLRVGKGP